MTVIAFIHVVQPGDAANDLLRCLEARTPGIGYAETNDAGEIEVYLNALEVPVHEAVEALTHHLAECADDWKDYFDVAVGPSTSA